MERRDIIKIATISSVGLSGCLDNESVRVGLGKITMTNVRADSIETKFIVKKGGETVYNNVHTLSGTNDGPAGSIELVEPWMGEKTEYHVTVSVLNTDQRKSFSTEDANDFVSDWGDNECFLLSITPDSEEIYFALGTLDSCPE